MFDETNIKTGTQAEKYVAQELAKKDYWVGSFEKGVTGTQPFDQIAINENHTLVYDVKHCKDDYFHFGRVEENQKYALDYIFNLMNPNVYVGFIIVYDNKPYWLSYRQYIMRKNKEQVSIKPSELTPLERVI